MSFIAVLVNIGTVLLATVALAEARKSSFTDPNTNWEFAREKRDTRGNAPHFSTNRYTGCIYETVGPSSTNYVTISCEDSRLLEITAQYSANYPVRRPWLIDANGIVSQLLEVDENGNVKSSGLQQGVGIDYESIKELNLTVKTCEKESASGPCMTDTATATLSVTIQDENDWAPAFRDNTMQAGPYPEDTPIGTTLLQVFASDRDSGRNGEIVFSTSDSLFNITTVLSGEEYRGDVILNGDLDFDSHHNIYNFIVTATDKGISPKSTSAQVFVTVTNINDNEPEIDITTSSFSILDTSKAGAVVAGIRAIDKDGDGFLFSLTVPGQDQAGNFRIDTSTGTLEIINDITPDDPDTTTLKVIAVDDGTCCEGSTERTSSATFTINIVSENMNSPSFKCRELFGKVSVKEGLPAGTFVHQIKATDPDRGESGRIIYQIDMVTPEQKDGQHPFYIDPDTGNITLTRKVDRETVPTWQVTVRGQNPPPTPLQGLCTFPINIEDVNDNAPVFSEDIYEAEIFKSAQVPILVMQMSATDKDSGLNANITYSMTVDGSAPNGMFSINPFSGIILLENFQSEATTFNLTVTASDNGVGGALTDSAVVMVKVNTAEVITPNWIELSPVTVNVLEDVQPSTIITTLHCNSSNGADFHVSDSGSGKQTSEYFSASGPLNPSPGIWPMNLIVKKNLDDHSKKKQYRLIARCQRLGILASESSINIVVNVGDANNNAPQFVGLSDQYRYVARIREGLEPGVPVISVSVTDLDETPAYKNVTFSISGQDAENFTIARIDDRMAEITTTIKLDREIKPYYAFELNAVDNPTKFMTDRQNSADPVTVEVFVLDVNDNKPEFVKPLYTHDVDEETSINNVVFSVTANDLDTVDIGRLKYSFIQGNVGDAFNVVDGSGDIRVSKRLDYENENQPKDYTLILEAKDQDNLHSASTTVKIHVLDINDNFPQFSQSSYVVQNVVTEEDTSISFSNPLFLKQVNATDADRNRTQAHMTYSISKGDVFDEESFFRINENTGKIELIGVLDREAMVGNRYIFHIQAADELVNPKITNAEVIVIPMDINDNEPKLKDTSRSGFVEENSPIGTFVMDILADDPDAGKNGTVYFEILNDQSDPSTNGYFTCEQPAANKPWRLVTNTGSDNLDAETMNEISVLVHLFDEGTPQLSNTGTIKISILDLNDQTPYFPETDYTLSMSESTSPSTTVMTVSAIDLDRDPRNRNLTYSFVGSSGQDFFSVTSKSGKGLIKLEKEVDYDEGNQRNFTMTLRVSDGAHMNTTTIHIFVTDFNDNYPVFEPHVQSVTLQEEEVPGQFVASFSATDKDEGINAEITFSISRESDPRYEFYIDRFSGNLTTWKSLDREVEPVRELVIVATDHGEIPLSSSTTLTVTLTDINDNAPRFKENYMPKVEENVPYVNYEVVEIKASDPDEPKFGPPFGFKLPDNCKLAACQLFKLRFKQDGDEGKGSAIITTDGTFDREKVKLYKLPIVMWDMRNTPTNGAIRQTATNTLTITVGDKNDNRHKPGHQDIFVNYEENFGDVDIGRVYAEDLDDWDLPDKTFTFLSPEIMGNYFSVSSDTGTITMKAGVPPNFGTTRDPYNFKVEVYDRLIGNTEVCTVSVTVKKITDQAIRKSGSVRLTGITAEEFIINNNKQSSETATDTSKHAKFQKNLASRLGYAEKDNVEIVSLTDGDGYLDVRFAAHGSPYLNPSQLESVVMLSKSEIEKDVGITIQQVPVNLCLEELYEDGCYTKLSVSGQPVTINANGTSYVGAETSMIAESGCADFNFPTPVECSGDYCYNGGICVKDDWGVLSCQCMEGFDGPRCQQRRHYFDGSSTAFYKGLSICSRGHTSFDFITTEESGLLMYSGPISKSEVNSEDYIVFELSSGYPVLRLNLGSVSSSEVRLELNGVDGSGVRMPKLNDGNWHHVDIYRELWSVTLIIDYCNAAQANGGVVNDWSPCYKTVPIPGPNILLNVASFLQLGGHYVVPGDPPTSPSGVASKGFNGCIKDLTHNSKLYDLYYKPIDNWNSGENGCPREDGICQRGTPSDVCGQNADCVSSQWLSNPTFACHCHPGWYGEECDKEAPTMDLQENSFFLWELPASSLSSALRESSIQMMFRTRQTSGTLFYMSNGKDMIELKLITGNLNLEYNLGDNVVAVTLGNAAANNGQWHTVRAEHHGNQFFLSLDNEEGRNLAYHLGSISGQINFKASKYISAGAQVFSMNPDPINGDLKSTCVRDIRFNDNWLPMTNGGNNNGVTFAELVDSKKVNESCTRPGDCVSVNCPPGSECFPLWEFFECRCASGTHEDSQGICVSKCLPNPCFNDVACSMDDEGEVSCLCPSGWEGPLCNIISESGAASSGMSGGAIAGIVIGIILALVLLILLILLLLKCQHTDDEKEKYILEVDPNDDNLIRENVMFYDEEGAGEEDHRGYDIELLQKPVAETPLRPHFSPTNNTEPAQKNAPKEDRPDVGSFIHDRIRDAENDDNDPLRDVPHTFAFEGGSSEAGSLSSLNTSSSGGSQDYDYLSGWGPKFARLADMYGAGQDLQE